MATRQDLNLLRRTAHPGAPSSMYCLFEISFSCTTSDSHSTRFCGEGTALIVLVVLVFRTLSLLQMNVYSSVSSSRLNFWGHLYLSSMMSACLLNSSWYSMPSTLLIFVLDTVSATASASQPSVSFLARLIGPSVRHGRSRVRSCTFAALDVLLDRSSCLQLAMHFLFF